MAPDEVVISALAPPNATMLDGSPGSCSVSKTSQEGDEQRAQRGRDRHVRATDSLTLVRQVLATAAAAAKIF